MDGWANGEVREEPSVLPLYLGLFLTLLAFFIMFIGASISDRKRPTGVATGGASLEVPAMAGTDADTIALSAVAGEFRRLGASMAGSVADTASGLDVNVPARSLFADREATIRPAAMAALDRTATALATPRGENRLVLQVTIGLGNEAGDTAAMVRRTAGLAAHLLQRGTPPDAFIAGTAPLAAGDIRFRFRLVGRQDDLGAGF